MREKSIEKVVVIPKLKQRKRVAAYVRVSMDKETMLHSFTAQASHYKELISKHKDWEFVDIYADYGISGTKVNRPEFIRMLDDCRLGKIDMIITKSISRFARNTALLLSTIRHLKSLHIDVYFEEQNINSLSGQGELMLTLLGGIAEAEAKSMSENVRWSISKFFKEGKVWGLHDIYGYRAVNSSYEIKENEAEVIRLIFKLYTQDNFGFQKIANILNDQNISSPLGFRWRFSAVRQIINNITYVGDLMLGKASAPMNQRHGYKTNKGEFPIYHVLESHPAIISMDDFNKAQEIMAKKDNKFVRPKKDTSPFHGLIKCADCGRNYVRKKNAYRTYWVCSSMSNRKATNCNQTLSIREDILIDLTKETLKTTEFNETLLKKNVEKIVIHGDKNVDFELKNKEIITLPFEFKSRSLSWTPEMKKQASKDSFKRWKK